MTIIFAQRRCEYGNDMRGRNRRPDVRRSAIPVIMNAMGSQDCTTTAATCAALLAAREYNPFAVLGLHGDGPAGWRLRVFRP
jgi:hypothetical protein